MQIGPEQKLQNALYKRNVTSGQSVTGQSVTSSQSVTGQHRPTPEAIDPSSFDPVSWSIYGRKCRSADDVTKFFRLMRDNAVRPNKEIYTTVLRSVPTWGPRLSVLQRMARDGVAFDRATVAAIEHMIGKTRDKIKTWTDDEVKTKNFGAFYSFQELYATMLDRGGVETVTTGDRKIVIDDLPLEYSPRR